MDRDIQAKLGLKYPLIVAPMAGGPSSVDLVVESSNAGALGSIGAAYLNPEAVRVFAEQVRLKTNKPFAINLFIPNKIENFNSEDVARAMEATREYRQELGLIDPDVVAPFEENFDDQFEQVLKLKPAVLSFVFGQLSETYLKEAKKQDIYLIGTATTLEEAHLLSCSGVDAIVLQGYEAGGHRGIFDVNSCDPDIGIYALLKQCVGEIRLPLIAAGGIMNSNDIQKALSLGAQAVQMGTAFLLTKESGASIPYKKVLGEGSERNTKLTRVFSGRIARGVSNRFMIEMENKGVDCLLPFPVQNKFTRDLRNASLAVNSSDFLSLWAGAGKGDLWRGHARDLIFDLFKSE